MSETLLVVNTIALFLSPLIAVALTFIYSKRRERYNVKQQVFLTLLIYRKAGVVWEKTNCLNSLYAIFVKYPKVIQLWEEYHTLLIPVAPNVEPNWESVEHKYTQLLSELARILGYKGIEQVALDKFYFPRGAGESSDRRQALEEELLRVLKKTDSLIVNPSSIRIEETPDL